MIQRLLRLSIPVLLTACGSETDTPLPGPFTITPTSAWSGNVVEVRGAGAGGLTGAQLDVGPLTLPLVRINDTALSTTLPDTISGTYETTLRAAGASYALGEVAVHGFVRATSYSQEETIWGTPEAYPRASGQLLGSSDTQVILVDLDARTVSPVGVENNFSYNRAPGPTYQAGVWLLASSTGETAMWRLFPTPLLAQGYPEVTLNRYSMLLGPGQWWTSTQHQFSTTSGGDVRAEETDGGALSPRLDRATQTAYRMNNGSAGVPVFSVPAGEYVWSAPLTSSDAVAFSADGEVLVIAGATTPGQDGPPSRLMAFRASDGQVLRDTTLNDLVDHVVFDDERALLYLSVSPPPRAAPNRRPAVVVLDRDTFGVVARLALPASVPAPPDCCETGAMTTSQSSDRLFLYLNNGPATTFEFSLPRR